LLPRPQNGWASRITEAAGGGQQPRPAPALGIVGLEGNTGTQVHAGYTVANLASAQPGDLVFFGQAIAAGEPHHVDIFVGPDDMIDAPRTGTVVRHDRISGFGAIDAVRRITGPVHVPGLHIQ
jgi:cell wall-associated NlpC family hydrolase